MQPENRKRRLQDVVQATLNVLGRLPLLNSLDEEVKYDIAWTLYDYLKGRFADKENISDNCNWPYICEGLKELPLFCVITEKHLDKIAQHIERELFPYENEKAN
jgi:hypothetical protein